MTVIIDKTNLHFYNALWNDKNHQHAYPNVNTVRCEAWYFRGDGSKRGTLLDYGHGCGAETLHFAKLGYQVHALEVSPSAQERLLEKLASEENQVSDLVESKLLSENETSLPYADDFFDYISSTQVVYHLPDETALRLIMKEWHRVLRPGGKILFSTIGPGNSLIEEGRLIKKEKHLDIYEHVHPHDIGGQKRTIRSLYIPTEKDVRLLCTPFAVDEVGWYTNYYCGIDGFHWQVLARKI